MRGFALLMWLYSIIIAQIMQGFFPSIITFYTIFLIIYEYYINILFTIKHIAQNIFIIIHYNIVFHLAYYTKE